MSVRALGQKKVLKNRKRDPKPAQLIVTSFAVIILIGTFLLMLPFATRAEGGLPLINAFFTATSATCVTGLATNDIWHTFTTFGQVVVLLLIQVGGLGLVTIVASLNFIVGKRLGLRNLQLVSESTGAAGGEIPSIRKQIVSIIKIALGFELAGTLLFSFYFVPKLGLKGIYTSVFLSVSMFCNAGLDILSQGEKPFTSFSAHAGSIYILTVTTILVVGGGLGFVVWHDLATWYKTRRLTLHSRIVLMMTALLIVLGTVGIFFMERNNPATLSSMSTAEKWLHAFFQAISVRTAGINTIDCAAMNDFTKLLMSALMFIGAASGSTGGGIKVTTLAVIVLTVVSVLKGQEDTTVWNHKISKHTVYKSITIFFLGIVVLFIASILIHANTEIANLDTVDSIFEAASAFSTVGLTVGVTSQMNSVAKVVTILTMYIGHCGPVSLATSLTFRGMRGKKQAILPEGRIMVG